MGSNLPMTDVFCGLENYSRTSKKPSMAFEIGYDPTTICIFLTKLLNFHDLQVLNFYN